MFLGNTSFAASLAVIRSFFNYASSHSATDSVRKPTRGLSAMLSHMDSFHDEAFFSAVATVIPVLVLAVTLQGDLLARWTLGYVGSFTLGTPWERPYSSWSLLRSFVTNVGLGIIALSGLAMVGLGIWGEIEALDALANQSSSEQQVAVAWIGILALLLLAVFGLIARVVQLLLEDRRSTAVKHVGRRYRARKIGSD